MYRDILNFKYIRDKVKFNIIIMLTPANKDHNFTARIGKLIGFLTQFRYTLI